MKKLIQILIVFGLVATMCGSTFGEVTKDGQHIPTIEKLFQDKVPGLDPKQPFFGCIFQIDYGEH